MTDALSYLSLSRAANTDSTRDCRFIRTLFSQLWKYIDICCLNINICISYLNGRKDRTGAASSCSLIGRFIRSKKLRFPNSVSISHEMNNQVDMVKRCLLWLVNDALLIKDATYNAEQVIHTNLRLIHKESCVNNHLTIDELRTAVLWRKVIDRLAILPFTSLRSGAKGGAEFFTVCYQTIRKHHRFEKSGF